MVSSSEADGTTFTRFAPARRRRRGGPAWRSRAPGRRRRAENINLAALAQDQLRESQTRFRLLVEAVKDYAIFMLDPSGAS